MTSPTKIALLGTPYIEHQGEVISLPRRKALAFIAYLAINGHQHRDTMATLLWEDYDDQRARANLRRLLGILREAPIKHCLHIEDSLLGLDLEQLWVDVKEFERLITEPFTIERLTLAIDLYRDYFMCGFSLQKNHIFSDWQVAQVQMFEQHYFTALSQLASLYTIAKKHDKAITMLQRYLTIDPLNEEKQTQLMQSYVAVGQRSKALAQYETYAHTLAKEMQTEPEADIQNLYRDIKTNQVSTSSPRLIMSSLPPMPSLFIGREVQIEGIRHRLSQSSTGHPRQVTIPGWPGVGKSTLAATLARDEHLRTIFPDGVLWVSLGENPDILSKLISWGNAIGWHGVHTNKPVEEISYLLGGFLRDKRMLLIIDDVWQVEHALPFKIGGQDCGIIITTRMNDLARKLSATPEDIYRLPILETKHAMALLRSLAPEAVATYPEESVKLVSDLEGLPLALQVAGRLLHVEMHMGWGVADLLTELRQGVRLLEAQAPADRSIISQETTPTVAALLERSVKRLSPDLQEKFALLGIFAPKPATFTLEAIEVVWMVDDPKPYVRALNERGLLDSFTEGQFQMHALLVMYAKSMFS